MKKLLKIFAQELKENKPYETPPIWLMRQAGRYLPEYMNTRSEAGSFLNLCYNPKLAEKVTLQPIERFGLDAAIMFSDILVIPHALGRSVRFETGEGPRLDPLTTQAEILKLRDEMPRMLPRLEPVFELLQRLSVSLPKETTLIGFSGSPWTLACYMLCGGSIPNFPKARLMAYQHPEMLNQLTDILVEAISLYLIKQVNSGAEMLQLFDSWSGLLDQTGFENFVINPTAKIIKNIRQAGVTVPIIGFPRGAGSLYQDYAIKTKINGLSLDPAVNLNYAQTMLQPHAVLQGNLEPLRLQASDLLWKKQVVKILSTIGKQRFIFNLGHGIDKETDPDQVKNLIDFIRDYKE